jgi:hypothetical protein
MVIPESKKEEIEEITIQELRARNEVIYPEIKILDNKIESFVPVYEGKDIYFIKYMITFGGNPKQYIEQFRLNALRTMAFYKVDVSLELFLYNMKNFIFKLKE